MKLCLKTDIDGFQDFLQSRIDFIASKKPDIEKLTQVAKCIAMAVINNLCSLGSSPIHDLEQCVGALVKALQYMQINLSPHLSISMQNLVIKTGLCMVNNAAQMLTQFMNICQSIGTSVIKAAALGPTGLVCLIPLFQQIKEIKWVLDLFKGFEAVIDLVVLQELYNLTDTLLKNLVGYLIPSFMGCHL